MIKKVYLARTNDENLWKTSSSGGAFWNLAVNMIENHKGICYGAKFTDDFRKVVHNRAETLEEAKVFRGSKYLQSDMTDCYSLILEDLKKGREVLFSGTPCQVMAVKKFIPDALQEKLLLVEFLCHGTPSPKVFRDYLAIQENHYHSKVTEIKFRGKKLKNSVQDMYIRFASGKAYKSFGTQDIYYNLFLHEMISRVSCANCPFANEDRPSDIVLSDYWGSADKIPDGFQKKSGLSGIFIITDKGEDFWQESLYHMTVIPSTLSVCRQGTLSHPITMNKNRQAFWESYHQQGLLSAFEQYFGSYQKMCQKRKVKNFLNQTGILAVIHKLKGRKR